MTTRLDFAGDLLWWQGLLAAGAGAWLVWRWYRRDVRPAGRPWAAWLLPGLRAGAAFALLVCLAGPVLTHRKTEGQLGRVLLFVDGSQSMGVTDPHLDAGRKLLIAAAHDPAGAGKIDRRLNEIARRLNQARRLAGGADVEAQASAAEDRIRRIVSELEAAAAEIERLDAAQVPEFDTPPGGITVEYFDGIPGSKLGDLTGHALFRQGPSHREQRDRFESRSGRGDHYGTRIRGYLYPPLTGTYTFWINSDDDSALAIGPEGDPSRTRVVARVDGFTPADQWEAMPSQKSAPVELRAGRRCYIEALHKEGTGEDFVRVGWTRPDGRQERPIPGIYLSAWDAAPLQGLQARARLQQEFENELLKPARRLLENRGRPPSAEQGLLPAMEISLRRWEGLISGAFARHAGRLIESADPAWRQAVEEFDSQSRWARAERLALDDQAGVLPPLVETHKAELVVLAGRRPRHVWSSESTGGLPERLAGGPDGSFTDLSEDVRRLVGERADRTAVVLLSDGRHNDGSSPLELARFLGSRGIPLHTVGLGNHREPPGLWVADVQAPQSVYADDRVKGQVVIKDLMPPGRGLAVVISNQGREVWKRDLTTTGEGLRRIDFDLAVRDALPARTGAPQTDVQVLSTPVSLQVRAVPADEPGGGTALETVTRDAEREMRFMVTTQGRRILLIDGRPRWETRFIRDLFDRDRQWRIDTLIQDVTAQGPAWCKVDSPGEFPRDREALFAYGLIIFGELPPGALSAAQMELIRDFVEKRGGALILIDGPRGHLREYERTAMAPLIPIGPSDSFGRSAPEHLALTLLGRQSAALRLELEPEANAALWHAFPRPHWVAPIRALEATETLAEVVCRDQRRVPALVYRRVGAGQVLYCSFEETWRWRYEVADRYQTKYWNQVANWLMESPFAVKDRFVALDAGGPAYQSGESARLRVQLSDRDGRPFADARAEVVLYRDGSRSATLRLEPDNNRPGLYRATSAPLQEGRYEAAVLVEGFSELETKARTSFWVEPRRQPELADLSCDEDLLRAMAAASGGTYFREEEAAGLTALLRPLSEGRIVVTETRLAQSYWWFIPIVLLLTAEWVIRKRIGLM